MNTHSLESDDSADAKYCWESFLFVCDRDGSSGFTPDLVKSLNIHESLNMFPIWPTWKYTLKRYCPHCFQLVLSSTVNFRLHMVWHLSHSNNRTRVPSARRDLCYIHQQTLSAPHLVLAGESQANGCSIIQKHNSKTSWRRSTNETN